MAHREWNNRSARAHQLACAQRPRAAPFCIRVAVPSCKTATRPMTRPPWLMVPAQPNTWTRRALPLGRSGSATAIGP